jgi:putative FmdB family regulatory protein
MPIYEYDCRGCGREFEILIQGSQKPSCPDCGGKRLDKKLSVFAVASSSGGASKTELPGPCGSCGHPDGPGSCGFG